MQIEFAPNFKVLLDAWNVKTNVWLRECVYKRVTPKGKKPGFASSMITFFTSAFWVCVRFLLFQTNLTDWFVLNSMGFPADIISLSLWEGSSLPLPGLQDLIFDHCSSHQHPTHPHLHLSLKGFMTSLASYSQSSSLTMPHPPSSCSLHATPC